MEVKKPVRKRVAKKKAAEKVVVKEEPQTTPEAPKINIIRYENMSILYLFLITYNFLLHFFSGNDIQFLIVVHLPSGLPLHVLVY